MLPQRFPNPRVKRRAAPKAGAKGPRCPHGEEAGMGTLGILGVIPALGRSPLEALEVLAQLWHWVDPKANRSCLPRAEVPHPWALTRPQCPFPAQGCPSALGNFIPGIPHPRDGGFGWDPMEFQGRSPGEHGLFSLEKGGLRQLHIPAGGTEQGEEPAGVCGELFKGNTGVWAAGRGAKGSSMAGEGQADNPWDFLRISPAGSPFPRFS